MPVDQDSSRLIFQKLRRGLSKLASNPAPQLVHKFRIYGRRVETYITELIPQPGRNHRKLLKQLASLRRKAGRVRDLDVQISSLRNLKIPEAASQKKQLLHTLLEERVAQEKKLAAAFDRNCLRELRKRLKRAANDLVIVDGMALKRAHKILAALSGERSALTEKVLHRYRVAGKRARYLAELAAPNAEAKRLVTQLKHMQDGIGDWHDWWKLTHRAEKLFGGVQGSPLVAALRNVTGAKFRQAVDTLLETRAGLAGKKPVALVPSGDRKNPAAAQADKVAAAVA